MFNQRLYAKNQHNKMKYTGKSLTVNVTELFTADLGALWGLECCPAVVRVERLAVVSSGALGLGVPHELVLRGSLQLAVLERQVQQSQVQQPQVLHRALDLPPHFWNWGLTGF